VLYIYTGVYVCEYLFSRNTTMRTTARPDSAGHCHCLRRSSAYEPAHMHMPNTRTHAHVLHRP
jgi:hypothetical protein